MQSGTTLKRKSNKSSVSKVSKTKKPQRLRNEYIKLKLTKDKVIVSARSIKLYSICKALHEKHKKDIFRSTKWNKEFFQIAFYSENFSGEVSESFLTVGNSNIETCNFPALGFLRSTNLNTGITISFSRRKYHSIEFLENWLEKTKYIIALFIKEYQKIENEKNI